ncbi:MAG: hypothetical protein V4702_03895 [Patescibacteria group bacterium]
MAEMTTYPIQPESGFLKKLSTTPIDYPQALGSLAIYPRAMDGLVDESNEAEIAKAMFAGSVYGAIDVDVAKRVMKANKRKTAHQEEQHCADSDSVYSDPSSLANLLTHPDRMVERVWDDPHAAYEQLLVIYSRVTGGMRRFDPLFREVFLALGSQASDEVVEGLFASREQAIRLSDYMGRYNLPHNSTNGHHRDQLSQLSTK